MDVDDKQAMAASGGKARAQALSKEERSEIAKKAAVSRWSKGKKATHEGELKINDMILQCAVLEDGTRVISETAVINALGMYRSGAVHVRERESKSDGDDAVLPLFVANKNVRRFVDEDLEKMLSKPIWFTSSGGGSRSKGLDARLLPKVCTVWLKARDAGVLTTPRQLEAARHADILIRGLAEVGAVALVDEATGYQFDREKNALAEILEAFISKELSKWVPTFPIEFYQELFRLRGMNWKNVNSRPQYFGLLTNDIVYRRLAPGVLEELRRINPTNENGNRKSKHHQWLTQEEGRRKLQLHLSGVITLMKASPDWKTFQTLIDRSMPKYQPMPLFDYDNSQTDAVVPAGKAEIVENEL
ncbi:hypothetical protein HNQ07_000422 [Deinococcus metalli]|nr:P63C domain-containing protein [Deinococcus metalli]MBB5374978.1 hypothetical protein [Deinococcus metalli]